jgi:small subunit ribosomal protein S8
MNNDKISDMLTQIRNAIAVQHRLVIVSKTRMTLAITKVLYNEGYILSYDEFDSKFDTSSPIIAIGLKYFGERSDKKSVINTLKRISKPGLRVYSGTNNLPKVLGNFGVAIISTSKGVMTNIQAKQLGIGGEILCYIW